MNAGRHSCRCCCRLLEHCRNVHYAVVMSSPFVDCFARLNSIQRLCVAMYVWTWACACICHPTVTRYRYTTAAYVCACASVFRPTHCNIESSYRTTAQFINFFIFLEFLFINICTRLIFVLYLTEIKNRTFLFWFNCIRLIWKVSPFIETNMQPYTILDANSVVCADWIFKI